MAKISNLYHSALAAMGPVRVTVKAEQAKSKYPNKPNYVTLTINGVDHYYSAENPGCADFFNGTKGRTFTIVAEGGGKGSPETAQIVYVGEAAPSGPPQPQHAPPPPQTATPASLPPPAAQSAAAPQRGAAPATKVTAQGKVLPHGAQVGACVNKAVDVTSELGVNPSDPIFYRTVYEIASDLIRVSQMLERGELAPSAKERQAAAQAAKK